METTQYIGQWVSPKREVMKNPDGSTTFLVRDFTMTENEWKLVLSGFGDESSNESKLFEAVVEGHYEVVGNSPTAEGAVETNFGFEKITFTPFMDFFVPMLNNANSGNGNWVVGESQDVSSTGALFFAPVSQYPKEYDLLKLDGSNLYFGKRPADNNMGSPERRPTEVTADPVTKVA